MTSDRAIQDQVKLPLSVALGVVMQGIRTRLGRSIVTITGVVLGIAFLSSILTTQVIRAGVQEQTALRQEVARMVSFLTAETGPLDGRTVAVVQVGALSEAEEAFARRLDGGGLAELRWTVGPGSEAARPTAIAAREVPLDQAGRGARVVVLAGADAGEAALSWETLLPGGQETVVASTRQGTPDGLPARVRAVSLVRELRPEEQARQAEARRQSRYRNAWIIAISLLVTVIGVSNAMLMSVTERFREIGTMKCLGALSAFIRQVFLIESSLMGLVGSVLGALAGAAFATVGYSISYGGGLVLGSMDWLSLSWRLAVCVAAGVVLAIVAALYPARFASRMVPASALRSNI